MSVKGIHWAQGCRGVGPMKKCLLLNLGERHHIDTGLCIVDRNRLAEESEMSVRSVAKFIAELEADGFLTRKVLPSERGRITHYELHFDVSTPQSLEGVRQTTPDPSDEGDEANSGGVRQTAPDGSCTSVPDGSGSSVHDRSGTCVPSKRQLHEEHEVHGLASQQAVREKVSKALGPRGQRISEENIASVTDEWLKAGATVDEIVQVVGQQTAGGDRKPIASLRALTKNIEAAIAARPPPGSAKAMVPPRPRPDLVRPDGRAGECLDEIISRFGMGPAEAWLAEAGWSEDEVLLPTDYSRLQVDQRFGGVLRNHGFTTGLKGH